VGLGLVTATSVAIFVYMALCKQPEANTSPQNKNGSKLRGSEGKSRRAQLKAARAQAASRNNKDGVQRAPSTERNLPACLATGSGPIVIPHLSIGEDLEVDLVTKMARALATEVMPQWFDVIWHSHTDILCLL
jgi:hypothetical protein